MGEKVEMSEGRKVRNEAGDSAGDEVTGDWLLVAGKRKNQNFGSSVRRFFGSGVGRKRKVWVSENLRAAVSR